jgi:hypothetical protein
VTFRTTIFFASLFGLAPAVCIGAATYPYGAPISLTGTLTSLDQVNVRGEHVQVPALKLPSAINVSGPKPLYPLDANALRVLQLGMASSADMQSFKNNQGASATVVCHLEPQETAHHYTQAWCSVKILKIDGAPRTAKADPNPELKLPDERALAQAKQRCADAGYAAGNSNLTQACVARNEVSWEYLKGVTGTPFRVEYWAACHRAAGGAYSLDLFQWAKCVQFAEASCDQTTKSGSPIWNQCVRAIQTRAWLLR